MAETKGQSAAVKKVAAQIVATRSRANTQLLGLAKKKGLGVSTENIKARNMGKDFDRQYLYSMEKETEEDVRAFQHEAKSGNDRDIKSWAAKTVPMIKSDLAAIKRARGGAD